MATTPKPTKTRKGNNHNHNRKTKGNQVPKTELPLVVPAFELQVPLAEEAIGLNLRLADASIPVWARMHGFDEAHPEQAGLRPMIARILIAAKAAFPLGSEDLAPAPGQDAASADFQALAAAHRSARLASCLSVLQIHRHVQGIFGEGVRYSLESLSTVLSTMAGERLLGVIRPTTEEEPERDSKATHARYYLNSTPPPPKVAKRGFQAAPLPKA